MLILYTLLQLKVLNCEELLDSSLLMTYGKTLLNFILVYLALYNESKCSGETFPIFCMETMNARINWTPFLDYIRGRDRKQALDFGGL